jgi:hypothetical protein
MMGKYVRMDDVEDFQDKMNRLIQASKQIELYFEKKLLKVQPATLQVALVLTTVVDEVEYTNVTVLHQAPEPTDGNIQPLIDAATEQQNKIMDKFKRACPGVKQIPGTTGLLR